MQLSSGFTILYFPFSIINNKLQVATEKVLKHMGGMGLMLINANSLPEGTPLSLDHLFFNVSFYENRHTTVAFTTKSVLLEYI